MGPLPTRRVGPVQSVKHSFNRKPLYKQFCLVLSTPQFIMSLWRSSLPEGPCQTVPGRYDSTAPVFLVFLSSLPRPDSLSYPSPGFCPESNRHRLLGSLSLQWLPEQTEEENRLTYLWSLPKLFSCFVRPTFQCTSETKHNSY